MRQKTITGLLAAVVIIQAGGVAYGQVRRQEDPLHNFAFSVEIVGIFQGSVSEISGIVTESEIVEYRQGGDDSRTRKSAGRTHYGNIVLRRGLTSDLAWWHWREALIKGTGDRKPGSIIILDERREEVMRWNFFEAWPVAYRLMHLDAGGSEKLVEEIEVAVEKIESG